MHVTEKGAGNKITSPVLSGNPTIACGREEDRGLDGLSSSEQKFHDWIVEGGDRGKNSLSS